MRMPLRLQSAVSAGGVVGHRRVERGRVARVVAGDDVHHQRGVGDGARQRADLVERGGEGDQAVAADPAVGRLEADDAAQRGRLADRAARVGAERERRELGAAPPPPSRRSSRRARARDPTGCGSGRTPSSRWTSPWRTRPCSILPSSTAPASARRRVIVPSSIGTKCSRIFEPAVVRMPRVIMTSLRIIGHARAVGLSRLLCEPRCPRWLRLLLGDFAGDREQAAHGRFVEGFDAVEVGAGEVECRHLAPAEAVAHLANGK